LADDDDDDDDNDNDDGIFAYTLREILGTSCIASPTFDLHDALGAVDSTVDLNRLPLICPPSPLTSSSSAAAAREPTCDPGVFTIILIYYFPLLVAVL